MEKKEGSNPKELRRTIGKNCQIP